MLNPTVLRNLMLNMWTNGNQAARGYIEPSAVLHAIKSAFPAFRGFQQHDSQVGKYLVLSEN